MIMNHADGKRRDLGIMRFLYSLSINKAQKVQIFIHLAGQHSEPFPPPPLLNWGVVKELRFASEKLKTIQIVNKSHVSHCSTHPRTD
jgi:hypothetical protein